MASEDETTISKTVHTVSPFLQLIQHFFQETQNCHVFGKILVVVTPHIFLPIFHTVAAPRNCRSPRCSPVLIFEAMPHLPCG